MVAANTVVGAKVVAPQEVPWGLLPRSSHLVMALTFGSHSPLVPAFGANRPSSIRSSGASVTAGVGLTFIARAAKLFGVGLTFIVGAGILLPEEVLIFEKRTWEKVQRSTCFCSRVLVLR